MELKPILRSCVAIPPRHIGLAVAAGMVVGLAFWFDGHMLPVQYTSSALLSYQSGGHFLAETFGETTPEASTIRLADSVLTPPILQMLADQVHFESAHATSASSALSSPATPDQRITAFRSHFDLEQPAPGLLQVNYHGGDQKQVTAASNALAGALSAWVAKPVPASPASVKATPGKSGQHQSPTPVTHPAITHPVPAKQSPTVVSTVPAATPSGPTPAEKRKAADLQHRADTLQENIATLALQQQNIEARILARISEEKSIERSVQKASTNPAAGSGQATPEDQRSRLVTIEKDLVMLRDLRSTVVKEEASEKEQVQGFKAQSAALLSPQPVSTPAHQIQPGTLPAEVVSPPVSPAQVSPTSQQALAPVDEAPSPAGQPKSDELAQPPSFRGSFTVVTWADSAHPLGDDTRRMIQWTGAAGAILVFLAYLSFTAWRFRPLSNPASLRNLLPRGIKYLGAVAGSPLVGTSLANVSPVEKSL